MKRLLLVSAATLMLAGLWTEPASSLDRPYIDPESAIGGGPAPDHPWGGDNVIPPHPSSTTYPTRPSLTAVTGFGPVDLILSVFRAKYTVRQVRSSRAWEAGTLTPNTGTSTTSNTSANTSSGNGSLNN